jgi:hypothetical protein
MAAEQLKRLGLRTDFSIEEDPKIPITKSTACGRQAGSKSIPMADIHSLGFLELEIGDYLVNWCLVIHYS